MDGGLFGFKPARGRNPLGPEYGDLVSGFAVEHAMTRSVRDSAALLDATLGPTLGDPYPAPPPPEGGFAGTVRRDPGRLRIAYSGRNGAPFIAFPAIIANITGAPTMSLPLHWSAEGLPIGVHALARFGADAELFSLAGQLESARPSSHRWPALAEAGSQVT